MAIRVAAVGEIVEDCYLDAQGNEQRMLGGISCNFARSAQATGAEVTLFSAVGTDAAGKRLLSALTLDSAVRVLDGETAEQRIKVKPSGEREFCGFRAGVLTTYSLTEQEREAVRSYDAVHVPIQPETEHLLAQIDNPGLVADFSIDSATGDDPRAWCGPHLERLRVAFIGGSRAHLEALATVKTRGIIVLTCGADGAYAIAHGRWIHQPTLATRIVDTTGCGDAFAGAFTVSHFMGRTLEESLHAGAERAAIVAGRIGA